MNKLKIIFTLFLAFMLTSPSFAVERFFWRNNLRDNFIQNQTIIYTINPRTFGAKDYNDNELIEIELGEVKGTFINGIEKLKTVVSYGANTIYLLPITKTGKLKAMGTAGSLYAMDSFDTLNPQLFDETDLTDDINEQAAKFIQEAHKLGLSVIVDLPSCGSYDMSLEKPELFLKDKNNSTIYPADWTDVRLFKVYENDGKTLNQNLIKEHKKFIDLVQSIGADGIRADVAAIKPYEFWVEIINYAREKDKEFLFLAEASPNWENPKKEYIKYTSVEDLLKAGFDGYYSDWSDLKNIKTAAKFNEKLTSDMEILKKFNNEKSVIPNFATHDQVSPISYGHKYWQMVNWLNMTLPLNPYILDGFIAGDSYSYKYANQKADKSYTDDDRYYVHKNQMDIFNFSRAPYHFADSALTDEYMLARKFRYFVGENALSPDIEFLKTNNNSVFAFKKQMGKNIYVVIGNLDYTQEQSVFVKIPKLSNEDFIMPFKIDSAPLLRKNGFEIELKAFEVQVLYIKKDGLSK